MGKNFSITAANCASGEVNATSEWNRKRVFLVAAQIEKRGLTLKVTATSLLKTKALFKQLREMESWADMSKTWESSDREMAELNRAA